MPSPYSKDLRSKIIEAYQAGEGTQLEIAKRFKICLLTVKRYWKRFQETGVVDVKKGDMGRKPSTGAGSVDRSDHSNRPLLRTGRAELPHPAPDRS